MSSADFMFEALSPQILRFRIPTKISPGVRGIRSAPTSDMVRTAPGRMTRRASPKKLAREGKWKAASTLMIPSRLSSLNGRRVASPLTGAARAARRRSRPAWS